MKLSTSHDQPVSSWLIFFIILLGTGGLLGTMNHLAGEIKVNGYHHGVLKVVDTNHIISKRDSVIDTISVTYQPRIDLRHEPLKPIGEIALLDFSSMYLTYNPIFLVWMALISITVACSLALLPILVKSLLDIYRGFKLKPVHALTTILITLVIGWFMFTTNHNTHLLTAFVVMKKVGILIKNPGQLNVFIFIPMFAGLLAIGGQLLINHALTSLPMNLLGLAEQEQKIVAAKFYLLRSQLKFFLMIDAILIVFSVLTTDALRRSILGEISVGHGRDLFPKEFVYLYGLLFTFYLAIFYMPVYYRLKAKGQAMFSEFPSVTEPDNKEFAAIFLMQESPLDSFKVAFSILAPVISSLLPGLLN